MPHGRATIIVTGSSGFIGRAMCEAFAKDGYTVVGLDRPGGGHPPASATNIPCDVTSEQGVAAWAVIAFGEVARPARVLNIPMGTWIAAAPWLLSGTTGVSRWADVVAGVVLIALSIRRGRIDEHFGGCNRYLI